ncbi:MAG: FTR1 family protein [bacterium]
MGFSFLVCLREGVEMSLIVAILLGYLRNIDQKQHFKSIWMGVGVAAVVCIAIGVGLEVASREMDKRIVEAFEGFAMIFAVLVLTAMALWMKKQARSISSGLRSQVDAALGKGSVTALVLLAASSVGREGLETVLFLFAGSSTSSGPSYVLGGALGFAAAAAVGVVIYAGTNRFPMKMFFQVSGVVIIFIAAGMLATSVVKLYEAAIITDLGSRPWDTESFISMTSSLGKFLTTLVGYDSAPSTLQIGLYWSYLLLALSAFLFLPLGRKPAPKPAASTPESNTLAPGR